MKYTAEEVRAIAKRLHDDITVVDGDALMASDMLTAYAERAQSCEKCKGRGEVFNDVHVRMMTCPHCHGAREVASAEPVAQGESGVIRHVGDSRFESWFSEYVVGQNGAKQQARDAYGAGLAEQAERLAAKPRAVPTVPEGWVLVPREPTKAMLDAAMAREDDEPLTDWGKIIPAPHAEIYKAMLTAVPSAPDGESHE